MVGTEVLSPIHDAQIVRIEYAILFEVFTPL